MGSKGFTYITHDGTYCYTILLYWWICNFIADENYLSIVISIHVVLVGTTIIVFIVVVLVRRGSPPGNGKLLSHVGYDALIQKCHMPSKICWKMSISTSLLFSDKYIIKQLRLNKPNCALFIPECALFSETGHCGTRIRWNILDNFAHLPHVCECVSV